MADRFFPNVMPDFVSETPSSASAHEAGSDALLRLLATPYSYLSEHFKRTALDLKETVLSLSLLGVRDRRKMGFPLFFCALSVCVNVSQIAIETWGVSGQHVRDFTLYSGTLGTAFLLFKSYQVAKNTNDLMLCSQIVKACDSSSSASRYSLNLLYNLYSYSYLAHLFLRFLF